MVAGRLRLAFVSFSAAQTFNILALFLRFDNDGSSILDPLRDDAYGIFLVHYVVLWLQYWLFDYVLPGISSRRSSRRPSCLC